MTRDSDCKRSSPVAALDSHRFVCGALRFPLPYAFSAEGPRNCESSLARKHSSKLPDRSFRPARQPRDSHFDSIALSR